MQKLQKKVLAEAYKELERNLTDKLFLKKIRMSKKAMLELLSASDLKAGMAELSLQEESICRDVFKLLENCISSLSPVPEDGWLRYIYDYTVGLLFPEKAGKGPHSRHAAGRLFYLQALRVFLSFLARRRSFDPNLDLLFLLDEEIEGNAAAEEYRRFKNMCQEKYIYEFMRIGTEITPYNTLGHIAGVHFVACHVAGQMASAGVPVDMALVSGAAAGHDVGKYGCKDSEATRIPYLHYYYTDQCLKRNHMPMIAHIASNHSTWDLELENLSAESLALIYADFRVKSTRDENNREIVNFYTMTNAFDVILNKLDNVDEAKRERYRKVYAKIKDFEDYMISLGVNVDLTSEKMQAPTEKDPSLLRPDEVIATLKQLAVEHNINVMNKFNNEASFGNLLEAARSEKQWKSVRAYVNILDEYFTYMTQKQKQMTLHFLYELLMHREGDIRRQAATLMGDIIANYNEEYRKELPRGAVRMEGETESLELWERYLREIIFPDHRVTEQHKRWIGYSLKMLIDSVLQNCTPDEKPKYLRILLGFFDCTEVDDATAFILLDCMLCIPQAMCNSAERELLAEFAVRLSTREPVEIKISALRCAHYMTIHDSGHLPEMELCSAAVKIMANVDNREDVRGIYYLKEKIQNNIKEYGVALQDFREMVYLNTESTSDIFLENLKVNTPWIIKAVNIELLLDRLWMGERDEMLHIATHLSNLLKVSERVTVRHSAGQGLLQVIRLLPLDQRNEIVIELTKGLEIGEYQFSKYIPQYLGELALFLHPNELDEFLSDLRKLLESSNDRVASVTLNTLGELIKRYPSYKHRFAESDASFEERRGLILGMILRGLANYHEVVSQEAFLVIGQHIFGTEMLLLEEKYHIFQKIYKKMLTLITDQKESELSFFNNAASLNHIYRFISEYALARGRFRPEEMERIAYFPGTFDPFSLSHKGIVTEIRDLGFEVYLALDEFSWSKKTQARMIRRQLITMSVADEAHVYVFPDDIPVNLANPEDLKTLRRVLPDKELYIVVGSDVITNASSYKSESGESSIHNFNHVVFRRESMVEGSAAGDLEEAYERIRGNVLELTLPTHLEDISSTRIRENIDYNRDISNLIDPVAESFIYDNSLYLREPQYKHVMQTRALRFEKLSHMGSAILEDLIPEISRTSQNLEKIREYLDREDVKTTVIRDGDRENRVVALAAVNGVDTVHLYEEFRNPEVAAYLREKATGKMMVIGSLYFSHETEIEDIVQMIMTEALAASLEEDYTYAVYHPVINGGINKRIIEVLERQGFQQLPVDSAAGPIFAVDMKFPITLSQNVVTAIKEPFDRNERVLGVIEDAHRRLQRALTGLYPGNLVLSFNSGVMHHKLVKMITEENNVSSEPYKVRNLGPYMCVPFGKILKGMAVPNTVTKTLHTEKKFDPRLKGFTIDEFPFYSPIDSQVKTIKSFNRPVILVDDLLHKGYRMQKLDPVLKENGVEVSKIIVGLLSGRGKDLMTIQDREVGSAYFIPSLRSWFVETSMYPFIGGDSVKREGVEVANLLPSINLQLPYAAPAFLAEAPEEAVYNLAMVCLENTRNILLVLEEEYQNVFARNLTLKRLSEAVISPRCPDTGLSMYYDPNLPPSGYILNDIERLYRLKNAVL